MMFLLVAAAQSTILLLLALVAARFVSRASVRHAIWTAAVLGSLVIPAASRVVPEVWVPLPVLFSPQPVANAERAQNRNGRAHVESDLTGELDATGGVGVSRRLQTIWPELAIVLWLFGALVVIARTIVSYRRADKLVRDSPPESSLAVSTALADAARHLPSRPRAVVRRSYDLNSPASAGCWRPVILLPADAHTWSPQRMQAVMIHELAHVVRRDCLAQLATQIACAAYWFNPLVWLAARRIELDRELACDDLVIASGVQRTAYAHVLLAAARAATPASFRDPAPLLTLGGSGHLEDRVRRILDSQSIAARLGWFARGAIAVGCAVTLLLVAVVRIGNAQGKVDQPKSGEPDLLRDSVARPTSERVMPTPSLDSGLIREALAGPDSALAAALTKGLGREPKWEGDLVRERATWALAQTQHGRLVEPLIAALANDDWRVRAYAAWALAYSRDRRATSALMAQLRHPVWRLRAMAAYALAASADPAARAGMMSLLLDPAWQVRTSVVTYLGRQRDRSLLPVLRARLGDRHVMVRDAAARALARTDYP
jgi:beta-lactamase regulating signal transducer with metallopeptidase domain